MLRGSAKGMRRLLRRSTCWGSRRRGLRRSARGRNLTRRPSKSARGRSKRRRGTKKRSENRMKGYKTKGRKRTVICRYCDDPRRSSTATARLEELRGWQTLWRRPAATPSSSGSCWTTGAPGCNTMYTLLTTPRRATIHTLLTPRRARKCRMRWRQPVATPSASGPFWATESTGGTPPSTRLLRRATRRSLSCCWRSAQTWTPVTIVDACTGPLRRAKRQPCGCFRGGGQQRGLGQGRADTSALGGFVGQGGSSAPAPGRGGRQGRPEE